MTEKHPLTIGQILSDLRPGQLWAALSAVVALLAGAFGLGIAVEGIDSKSKENASNEVIAGHLRTIAEKDKAIATLKDTMDLLDAKQLRLNSRTKFLDHYVAYVSVGGKTSEKNFVDYICALWKQSETTGVAVDRGAIQVSDAELLSGEPQEIAQLLGSMELEPDAISRFLAALEEEKRALVAGAPDVSKVFSSEIQGLNERLRHRGIEYTKAVKFPVDWRYEVPDKIAIAMHDREDCRPSG